MAGKDWLTSFLERNNTLSIRRPQATSMSRSTSFNKTNVTAFYNNLQTVLARYLFEAKDIWNVDETGKVYNSLKLNRVVIKCFKIHETNSLLYKI